MSHTVEFTCQDCGRDIITDLADFKPVCWVCRTIRLNPGMSIAARTKLHMLHNQSSSR